MGEKLISPDLDLISISGQDGRALSYIKKNPLLGIFGLFFALWSMVYSWCMIPLGGHRNMWSHGLIIGTIGRMIWFNLPLTIIGYMVSYNLIGIKSDFYYNLWMDYWLLPYLAAQFLAWNFSDAIHILLDQEFVKGWLYIPESQLKKQKEIKNGKY